MPKVTVSAICKNEIENLSSWYDSVKMADYVCVLDTGSTDGTWEQLQNLPITTSQKIISPWSFGKARTEAWQLIPSDTDYVVIVDLDERLPSSWRDTLQKELYNSGVFNIGNIFRKEFTGEIVPVPRVLLYNKNIHWEFPVSEEPFLEDTPLFSYGIYPQKALNNIVLQHLSKKTAIDACRTRLQEGRLSEITQKISDVGISLIDRILFAEQGISLYECVRSAELSIEKYIPLLSFLEEQDREWFLTDENYSFAKNLTCLGRVFLKEDVNRIYNIAMQIPSTDSYFSIEFLKYFIKYSDRSCVLSFFRKVLVDFEKRGICHSSEARNFKEMINLLTPWLGKKDLENLDDMLRKLDAQPFVSFKYTTYVSLPEGLQ